MRRVAGPAWCCGLCVALPALLAGPAPAQAPSREAAPLLTPRPVFVPGLDETESRNSRFRNQGVTSRTCFASADDEAFRRETIAQYETNPDFLETCRLSDSREMPDGFAFAMACKSIFRPSGHRLVAENAAQSKV